jgi:hypothetical protein
MMHRSPYSTGRDQAMHLWRKPEVALSENPASLAPVKWGSLFRTPRPSAPSYVQRNCSWAFLDEGKLRDRIGGSYITPCGPINQEESKSLVDWVCRTIVG